MKNRRCVCFAVMVASALPLSVLASVARAENPSPTYAFVNGHWFDGKGFVDRTMYSVLGVLHPNRPFTVDSTVDLAGAYVVPAFGEAHNHNAGMIAENAAQVTARYLREGIFYVKNPANLPLWRDTSHTVNVPTSIDVAYANGVFTAPDGHPVGLVRRNIARGNMTAADGEGAFYFAVATHADVDRKFPALLATRPDFVKTLLLFSEEFEKRRDDTTYFAWKGLDPKLLPYIVRKAHGAGLRVSTHVETSADFRAAVAAGVDEINHLPGFRPERDDPAGYASLDRYVLTDADASRAARAKVVVVTTVSETLDYLAADTSAADSSMVRRVRAMIVGNLQKLHRHGVKVALGSDRFRSTAAAEANALHAVHAFDEWTLLKMWSQNTPATIFPRRKLGQLKDGYEASFLALEGDPLQDFANVGRIRLRVKQGILLPQP